VIIIIYSAKDLKEKMRELEDAAAKMEKEIKEDIRTLLHAIEQRDTTLLASRKAFQKLDLDCKTAIQVWLLNPNKGLQFTCCVVVE